jgi:hypothetical protein
MMGRIVKQICLFAMVALCLSFASMAWSQEEGERSAAQVVVKKVFRVEHADVRRLSKLLQVFGVEIEADSELRMIAVRGPQESVAALEASLEHLDVPPKPATNIQLTVYLLNALLDEEAGGEIPTELEEVVSQIRSVFPYKGFRLWETLVLRTRDNQGGVRGPNTVSGVITDDGGKASDAFYKFSFNSLRLIPDEQNGEVVRINQLSLMIGGVADESPDKKRAGETGHASIRTDIDVREGQKVVVGKANIGASNSALILVVTARVLD